MSEVKIEKPTPEKLKKLGVEKWGIWECEPSTFDWFYDSMETCYFLEGDVKVTTPRGEVQFGKGDLVQFPKGLKCTWHVAKKVKKHYKFE